MARGGRKGGRTRTSRTEPHVHVDKYNNTQQKKSDPPSNHSSTQVPTRQDGKKTP